tara:strand:- start:379 stop:1245 length:867 start_codon:yes stop_codon:yes gene_type:complete
LAYEHLHAGRYEQGFRLFEYRWHPEIIAQQATPYAPALKMPIWRGESLLGKTITVQMEQGFGDIIMFARFLPALKALGAKKVVVLQEGTLHYLLGQIEAVDVFSNGLEGIVTESDYWIGSISLPYYLSVAHPLVKAMFPVTTKKIVASEGYLHAKPSNIPPKIGVNWEASKQVLYYIKSMDSLELEKLVGSDCYSLNPRSDALFHPLPDDGWKKDWTKTASHMKACKGIVTVDTGTAHLAGALGIKTIVLLPKEEFVCWRWKNGRWYDSVIALRPHEFDQIPELLRRM